MKNIYINHWYQRLLAGLMLVLIYIGISLLFPAFQLFGIWLLPFGMIAIEYMRGGNTSTAGFAIDSYALKEIVIGILAGIIPILLAIVILYSAGLLSIEYGKGISFSTMMIIFSSALLEECIFRGTIFQALADRFSPSRIIIIISIVFSLLHLSNPNADIISTINTFLANCFMSIAWYRSKGLWLPILYHASWNFTQSAVGIEISGIKFGDGFLKTTIHDSTFSSFFIGPYGIEGTVYCTVVLLLLIAFTYTLGNSPIRHAKLFRLMYPSIQSS